jgi:predicted AlkP superfamily pyrophosphatase or phosphodiesterase
MFAAGCSVRAAAAQDAPTPAHKKVLLIGIDGVRVDILAAAETPAIDSLAEAGFFSDRAFTAVRTVSGPGWASMLTGVRTEKHRIAGNDLAGNDLATYPDFLTRIEQVAPELDTFSVTDWPALGTTRLGGPLLSDAIDAKVTFNAYELGYHVADSLSVETAVERLSATEVDAAFVYIGEVDHVGHVTDSIGSEYRAAIELADSHVGRLVAALRNRPSFSEEDWLVLLSTDHGRNDAGAHGGDSPSERTIFFLASGPSVVPGRPACPPEIVDVAVTALVHMGITIDPAWELDGKAVGLGVQ